MNFKKYWVDDIQAHLFIRDETDIFGFIQDGKYEREETELIKTLVEPHHITMDIGANIGYFTVLLAKLSQRVYALEPEPSNAFMFQKNIFINNLKNVIFEQSAASDKTDTVDLHLCSSNHGMHRLYKSKWCDQTIPVQCVEIDRNFDFPHLDFVKIDVEGSELAVIAGMRRTIEKHHPKMLIEFHPPTLIEARTDPRELYNFLRELGYLISLAPSVTPIQYEDLVYRTNDSMGGQNILCMIPT